MTRENNVVLYIICLKSSSWIGFGFTFESKLHIFSYESPHLAKMLKLPIFLKSIKCQHNNRKLCCTVYYLYELYLTEVQINLI